MITAKKIQHAIAVRNPALRDKWNPVVHICVHAEICIILDFLAPTVCTGIYYIKSGHWEEDQVKDLNTYFQDMKNT
jgi:hypothetical protein